MLLSLTTKEIRERKEESVKCGLYDTGHNVATCEKSKAIVVKRPRGRPKGTRWKKNITGSDKDGSNSSSGEDSDE